MPSLERCQRTVRSDVVARRRGGPAGSHANRLFESSISDRKIRWDGIRFLLVVYEIAS